MTLLPAEFVMPDSKLLDPNKVGYQKPVYGNVGAQYVEFSTHSRFSGVDSLDQNKEVYRKVDICKIRNDKQSVAVIRVNDLTPKQKREMAGIYEQWMTQKDSTDTRIMQWEAISEDDKAFLIQAGVQTVEQLNAFEGEDIFRLGPVAKEFKAAATRHLITKNGDKKAEQSEDIKLILEENRKLRELVEKRDADYFAAQAAKVETAPAKKSVAWGKKKELTETQGE